MGNIYVGWVSASDPPSPWTRLTRQGKYIRTTSSTSNHLVETGSSTHTHNNAAQSFTCNNDTARKLDRWDLGVWAMLSHTHGAPSSWSTDSGNNTPPYYGIDIIYMDADTWENSVRSFPIGTLILSYSSISDSSLSRHTSSDGKFLYNTTPGNTGGSTSTHSHSMTATTAASGTSTLDCDYSSYTIDGTSGASHTHNISVSSSSNYQDPAYVQTRLYEVVSVVSKAFQYTVAFFSSTPSTNWTVLTSWANRLVRGGNSDPSFGGSDTHSHTFSGTTSSYTGDARKDWGDDESNLWSDKTHSHTFSGTTCTGSNVPVSTQLVPAYLTVTLVRQPNAVPQLVGLSSW